MSGAIAGAIIVLSGVLGLAVGSFLNVVIWRVPRNESLNRPSSACPKCGHSIRWYDNVPVLSWLVLRGRCRDCAEPISARYPLVEFATGLAFVMVAFAFTMTETMIWALPAYLYLVAVGIALALIDIDTHRLPNKIVLPSYLVALALLALASAGTGDWFALLRAAIGCMLLFTFYFVLALAVPRGMGFGDVKLAGVLGLYLAWLGWGSLAVGAFAAFLFGGIFSVGLLLARRVSRKSGIPFGPWMLAGAGVAIFFGEPIADQYAALVGLS